MAFTGVSRQSVIAEFGPIRGQDPHPVRWLNDPGSVYLTTDRLLRVEGAGARAWLNALVTADLRTPSLDVARYTLLLGPAGGIVSDAWVVESTGQGSDRLALVVPAARAASVYALLDKYLVNAELTLSLDEGTRIVALLGTRRFDLVTGEMAALTTCSSTRLGLPNIDVWVSAAEADRLYERLSSVACGLGGGGVDAQAWTSARVALAIPAAGVDFDETFSPHEAGIDGHAVSLSKGCYLGQELVARQHRRGGLARRLVQLEIDGAIRVPDSLVGGPSGAEGAVLRDLEGAEVGRATSAAAVFGDEKVLALGSVKAGLAEPGTPVRLGDRPARICRIVGGGVSSAK
jgi:folate-binding protein YgfZ